MMAGALAAGLDGGGSKTALCVMDGARQVRCRDSFGQLNVNGMDREAVFRTLAEAAGRLAQLAREGCPVAGLTIATAGISNPECLAIVSAGLKAGGYAGPIELRGDHEAALQGAVGGAGAVLIAGTGSICYGRAADGRSGRAGGWGYLLDDEGGGYALGRDILRAVLRAGDGRGPATALTEAVYGRLGAQEPSDLIRYAYDAVNGKANIAALAPLLQPAAAQGDRAAVHIVSAAAKELADVCAAVIDRLCLQEGELALMGGVLQNVAPLRSALKTALRARYPALRVIAPRQDAAWGAADLARQRFLDDKKPR